MFALSSFFFFFFHTSYYDWGKENRSLYRGLLHRGSLYRVSIVVEATEDLKLKESTLCKTQIIWKVSKCHIELQKSISTLPFYASGLHLTNST